jgi:uncharacterized protein (TIGR03437 family)
MGSFLNLLLAGTFCAGLYGQALQLDRIVNAVDEDAPIGSGSVATIRGRFPVGAACTAPLGELSLCDVKVTVDDVEVPLLSVDSKRVTLLVPRRYGPISVLVHAAGEEASIPAELLPASVTPFRDAGLVKATGADDATIGLSRPARPGETVFVYATGCGIAPDLAALAPDQQPTEPYPAPGLDVSRLHFADGSTTDVAATGTFLPAVPGTCVYALQIPESTPTGIATFEAGLWGVTNKIAQVPIADGKTVGGTLRAPAFMLSDEQPRALDTIVGTVSSEAGVRDITRSPNNHFLVDASGDATIALAGEGWEQYHNTVAVDGNVALDLPMLPRLVYTDVRGDYDRETRTWSNAGWYDPLWEAWRGSTTGGEVSLLTILRALGVNATNTSCRESTFTWPQGAIIPVYIDPNRQPFYDEQGNIMLGATSGPKPGVDAIKEMLQDYTAKTGRQFDLRQEPLEKITYNNGKRDVEVYNGIYIQFVPSSELAGAAGRTGVFPNDAHHDLGTKPCGPITGAIISIDYTSGYYSSLGNGVGAHEFSTAVGYGASGRVPFTTDNLGPASRSVWSTRDTDGRRMLEYLGPQIPLEKFGN